MSAHLTGEKKKPGGANLKICFGVAYRGADKSLARPGRKQVNYFHFYSVQ